MRQRQRETGREREADRQRQTDRDKETETDKETELDRWPSKRLVLVIHFSFSVPANQTIKTKTVISDEIVNGNPYVHPGTTNP